MAQMSITLARGVNLNLNVVISSGMEEKQILGYRKNETLERLIKTKSQIDEMERVIRMTSLIFSISTFVM